MRITDLNLAGPVWYPLPSDAPTNVAGYLDGLFDDEIRGWVADLAQPDRILTISIRINGVLAGKVTGCHYRGDLVSIFQSRGLHGFAFRVPDGFFEYTNWSVEVLLQDGRLLHREPIEIENPSAGTKVRRSIRTPCLLFIHIPKTAGTALWTALQPESGLSRHLLLYPDTPGYPGEYILYLTESQLSNLEFVYGHFGFRMHNFLPQRCEYATVLREPVARTLSHFFQLRRSGQTPADITVDEFFSEKTKTPLDNLMTRLISGETFEVLPVGKVNAKVLQHAIDNLHTWFTYVGIQAHMSEVQRHVAARLGLPLKVVERENTAAESDGSAISSATMDVIREMNEYDVQLYDYVRKHFWTGSHRGWVQSTQLEQHRRDASSHCLHARGHDNARHSGQGTLRT